MGAIVKLKRAKWHDLFDVEERQVARLASIASNDAWFGGARALRIAQLTPCKADGFLWTLDSRTAHDVVSSVYTSTNGTSQRFMAYECPECGCAHLGYERAAECCAAIGGEAC